MQMRLVIACFVLVACQGVSDDPPIAWDDAVSAFASAHCDWNTMCDGRSPSGCTAETTGVLTMQTRPELDHDQQVACIKCLQAWTAAYESATSPCASTLSVTESDEVAAACMAVNCVENHDLPGTSPIH